MDDTRSFESNLQQFDRYVMNEIPIRLIRLSDMKFAGRDAVRKYFRDSVPQYQVFYRPSQTVKYAILSHRWLDDGEPTYEEMKTGIAAGLGYEKLKKFCKEAQAYDVEFYRWYAHSEICIIHLAQSNTIEDIMHDEWKERGWTLQELLAPPKIKLFNKYWMPMSGDKNDKIWGESNTIMMTLERATDIPFDDLWEFKAGPHRVDERMMWAARRKTTRVEDVAYSLMGIFDVTMQIAYGEGAERAFCRLIEALMQSGDPSVLNWTGQAARHPSSWRAIPKSPRNYEGRTLRLPWHRWRLEMNVTSLGLRIPLVVLPLSVSSNNERVQLHEGGWDVTLECPLCPAVKINFIDYNNHNDKYQFAFGTHLGHAMYHGSKASRLASSYDEHPRVFMQRVLRSATPVQIILLG